jgi:hypothetical protein
MLVARYEAEVYGKCSPHGGHLLMALVWDAGGIAAQVLDELGVTLARTVAAAQEGSAPLMAVIARAAEEARDRGHDHIGTEHALLALASVDGALFARLGIGDQVQSAVERAIIIAYDPKRWEQGRD